MNRVREALSEHDGELVGRLLPGPLRHLPIFFSIAQGQEQQFRHCLGVRAGARAEVWHCPSGSSLRLLLDPQAQRRQLERRAGHPQVPARIKHNQFEVAIAD